MQSESSESADRNALWTLQSVLDTLETLIKWNHEIDSADAYYHTEQGMQLLAANCTLITAIGEGINRINRIIPDYLQSNFPQTPWKAIIGMRNRIAHGYFELDAEIVFSSIKNDFPNLAATIGEAIKLLGARP